MAVCGHVRIRVWRACVRALGNEAIKCEDKHRTRRRRRNAFGRRTAFFHLLDVCVQCTLQSTERTQHFILPSISLPLNAPHTPILYIWTYEHHTVSGRLATQNSQRRTNTNSKQKNTHTREKETTNDYLESIWCFLYSISIASHFYFLSFFFSPPLSTLTGLIWITLYSVRGALVAFFSTFYEAKLLALSIAFARLTEFTIFL